MEVQLNEYGQMMSHSPEVAVAVSISHARTVSLFLSVGLRLILTDISRNFDFQPLVSSELHLDPARERYVRSLCDAAYARRFLTVPSHFLPYKFAVCLSLSLFDLYLISQDANSRFLTSICLYLSRNARSCSNLDTFSIAGLPLALPICVLFSIVRV